MGIDIDIRCEDCNSRLDDGAEVYCCKCHIEIIEKLTAEIEELKEEAQEESRQLRICKQHCGECSNKLKCVTETED